MKLSVINEENPGEKVEIEIEEIILVKDLRKKINQVLKGNENWTKTDLIYKNIILNENNSIKWYKICDNDEIWYGKIENYLKNDDIIVEVFLYGLEPDLIWLIVKMNDSILKIRKIIEIIQPKIIDIWNWERYEMRNDQIVTEIDKRGYYRLIMSCCDEKENILPFEDCRNKYYRFKFIFYYSYILRLIEFHRDLKEMTRNWMINKMGAIRRIISSNKDERLNENLSELPSAFVNSNFLFCHVTLARIWEICNDNWELMKNMDDSDEWNLPGLCFQITLLVVLCKYSDERLNQIGNADKSISAIVIDALDYFVKLLNDWERLVKFGKYVNLKDDFIDHLLTTNCIGWMKPFLLIFKCYFEFYNIFYKPPIYQSFTELKLLDRVYEIHFQSNPKIIIEAKKAIAYKFRINIEDLYCINLWNDDKSNDTDPFTEQFVFQIVIELKNLTRWEELDSGSFSTVYRCRDEISLKNFVIKKPKHNQNLHRDIFIGFRLFNKPDIFTFSAIGKDEDGIYLVMDLLKGTLSEYIKEKKENKEKLEEEEIVSISYQILTQINELHKSQIIHRDIKSDNIISDGKCWKLIGFGRAKFMFNMTKEKILEELKVYVPGTLGYMAPELIKEEPYSYKIDIWSFGMVMVEMVTGKPPSEQITLKLDEIKEYKFKPIVTISNTMKQFIDSCLTVDPAERPTCQQLIESQLIIDHLKKHNKCQPF